MSFAAKAVTIARAIYTRLSIQGLLRICSCTRCKAVTGEIDEAMDLSRSALELTPMSASNLRWLVWLQAATGAMPTPSPR